MVVVQRTKAAVEVPVVAVNPAKPTEHALTTLKYVRKQTNRVILFYSGGKDSIVLLDMLSFLFDEVICVFMYFIKDLEHQRVFIEYPEKKYPNARVIQLPHWMVSHYYRNNYYKFHRKKLVDDTPLLYLGDIEKQARLRSGATWIINGAKMSDSLNRHLMLGTLLFNSINLKSKRAYPLALWKKKDVLAYIKNRNLIIPQNYGKGKSNGIDLTEDVLVWMRDNYPDDYKKVIHQFPFAGKIVFEHDYKKNHKTEK